MKVKSQTLSEGRVRCGAVRCGGRGEQRSVDDGILHKAETGRGHK